MSELREDEDRLIDSLLHEVVGSESPPDLRERILARVSARARTRRSFLLVSCAAALLVAAGIFIALPPRSAPSQPVASKNEPSPAPSLRLPASSPPPAIPQDPPREVGIPKEATTPLPAEPAPLPKTEPAMPPSVAPTPEKKTEPAPGPSPALRTPNATVAAVATVARILDGAGELFVVGREKKLGVPGLDVFSGQGMEIVGSGWASLGLADGSRIELWGDTFLREILDSRIVVEKGTVLAQIAKQPKERGLVFATPQANVTILGSALRLDVDPDPKSGRTRLEVLEGKVRFARAEGRGVEVSGGQYAIIGSGVDPVARALPKALQGMPPVDQKKVDEAIRRGIEYLKKAPSLNSPPGSIIPESYELPLWTLVHANVPQTDPLFQKLLKDMLASELTSTYRTSLQAMILEEIDRVKYQERIWQCAQALVDNQCRNGQWSYWNNAPKQNLRLSDVPTLAPPKKEVATTGGAKSSPVPDRRPKPAVRARIPVKKMSDGPLTGDNSNSQYAALGLRACHDAGIMIPKEILERGKKWWVDCQKAPADKNEAYPARGWCYGKDHPCVPHGAMTAGAVGSLVIYDYLLGEKESWKKDPTVQSGLAWMAKNFSVDKHPGPPNCNQSSHYYYLYALERMGILYGTEFVGRHPWYPEGVQFLLGAQKADGSWLEGEKWWPVWDTCFAILFLRRATRPLQDVASVDSSFKPK